MERASGGRARGVAESEVRMGFSILGALAGAAEGFAMGGPGGALAGVVGGGFTGGNPIGSTGSIDNGLLSAWESNVSASVGRTPYAAHRSVMGETNETARRCANIDGPATERNQLSMTTASYIGYARVSTGEQTLDAQRDALCAAGCTQIFEDVISGATTARSGLDGALAALSAGDTLVVARLDRLGRSMPHLVATVHELADRGVGFKSLAEAIDTTSAAGRLVLHIFASLADFERELIRERTREALAARKRRGEHIGRRPVLTSLQVAEVRKMVGRGDSPSHVARLFGCGIATVYRALKGAAA
jgi:DNA invertase Pin-like site-specific DNA recombinase